MSETPTTYEVVAAGQTELSAMSVDNLVRQVVLIQEVMKSVMQDGQHYGVIPGTPKPSLYKPGAEKLGMVFRMAPRFTTTMRDLGRFHREYEVVCELSGINNGIFLGSGVGSANTMEAKYRYRKAEQKCPKCGKETIIKGKKEYGGGWLCYAKKGGCGAKFKDGDTTIENQNMGRVEHDNPADYFNTILKMAKKRAFVDAILTATAASDIFTQDVEDMVENGVIEPKESAVNQKPEPLVPGTVESKFTDPVDPNAITTEQKAALRGLYKLAKKLPDETQRKEALAMFDGINEMTTSEAQDLIDYMTPILVKKE